MRHRRTAYLVGIVTAVFIAVTFGVAPAINLIARLRSPHRYSQYDVTGAWALGALAAALAGGAYAGLASRQEGRRARASRSPTPVTQDGVRRVLSAPNVCTVVGATIIGLGLGLGNAADNVVRFNQNRPFTVSLGGVVLGSGSESFSPDHSSPGRPPGRAGRLSRSNSERSLPYTPSAVDWTIYYARAQASPTRSGSERLLPALAAGSPSSAGEL